MICITVESENNTEISVGLLFVNKCLNWLGYGLVGFNSGLVIQRLLGLQSWLGYRVNWLGCGGGGGGGGLLRLGCLGWVVGDGR